LRQHIDINESYSCITAPCLFITVADVSKGSCEAHERTVTVEKNGKEDIGLIFSTDGVSHTIVIPALGILSNYTVEHNYVH
jgi:hypothetical protein